MPDAHRDPEKPPVESVAPPPGLARALAGMARHEAAVRAYESAVLRLLCVEGRSRGAAASISGPREERKTDREAREAWEADQVHHTAARLHRAALREELTHYVRSLKGGGTPPERVLVLVKALVSEAAKAAEPPLHDAGRLTDELVRWSLDAYYSAA